MAETFSSDLARRLLRRGTEPIGVIDVRPAQDRYARATAWPRQHLGAIDRVAARHHTDAPPGQHQQLLLASRLEPGAPLRDMVQADSMIEALRSSTAPALSPASLARIAARQGAGRSGSASAASAP